MVVPILLENRKIGTLQIRRDGAYTLFEARMTLRPGLQRLYVFGPGGRGCLGVLRPERGELTLRRRLSRADLRAFPARIDCASPEERAPAPSRAGAPPPERGWHRRPDGSLVRAEGGRLLLALPCALRRAVPGVDLRRIDGESYLVFPLRLLYNETDTVL